VCTAIEVVGLEVNVDARGAVNLTPPQRPFSRSASMPVPPLIVPPLRPGG
jgi:hypothetical protein